MTRPSRILGIDVGGSGLKAAIVDANGKILGRRVRVKTPHPGPPDVIVPALVELAGKLGRFDHIAIGFPGYVKRGRVITAPNLGTEAWAGYPLAETLARKLGKPAKLANDADMQGLAAIEGTGLELAITLGTGFGSSWFRDGELLPHMELAHYPARHGGDYDAYLGDKTRKKIGSAKWNKRVQKTLATLATVFNYDHLYIGGGNAHRIKFKLPPRVSLVSNDDGLKGGAWLWHARTKA